MHRHENRQPPSEGKKDNVPDIPVTHTTPSTISVSSSRKHDGCASLQAALR
ncbi:hypothetical protein GMO_13320 [Gluconobacter morbifer G707]|uniref:Uncharacterized protein n=1 Tax=Gluconobacter morbifer G707 TaxID=1088869 RepID=G6XIC2_9PROT|nr:hypothetical protein GMO_13320 [Gluconobacter morbifer G707]